MVSLRNRAGLLRGLLHGQAAFTGPAWVTLEVTRKCNTFCTGCFGRSGLDEAAADLPAISPGLIRKICEELYPLGTREIIIAGFGEPLLHPGIFDFISAFKRTGFRVQLFTNGIVLEEPVARSIVESGLDDLRVTIWATDGEQYAALHPGTNPAHLKKRIEGMSRVIEARRDAGRRLPRVHFQAPLNRVNFTDVDARVQTAICAGCDSLCFGYYRHYGHEFESLCLDSENVFALAPALERAKKNLSSEGIAENIDEYRTLLSRGPGVWREIPCYAGWFHTNILADGKVLACGHCSLVVGDLSSQTFSEIWNGPEYRKFRRLVSKPGGAAVFGRACDCEDCCQMKDNLRVHRIFCWLAPWTRLARKSEPPSE
jgi:MoaA/NifB/PqqE/SkfB family radical SAM enzyme